MSLESGVVLRLEGVRKTYSVSADADGKRVEVLSGVSFEMNSGDLIAVTGPSGSGQPPLLKIVGGLDVPDSGEVVFKGRGLSGLSDDELAAYRNSEVGFVFQEHALLPQCDVLENVLLPCLASSSRRSVGLDVEGRAMMLLERVGLARLAGRFPSTLSGGERQRVAVARALINCPALILADEPTGALDRSNSDNLAGLLRDVVSENGAALILATHSERLASRMDGRLRLWDGRLEEDNDSVA